MTGSMTCCAMSVGHHRITARPCPPEVRHMLGRRLHWPSRCQNACPIADAECVITVHGIYDRLTITLIVRVAYHTLALHEHAWLALFNIQAPITTISSPVSRSVVACFRWWRVEAEHCTEWLVLCSTDRCRHLCVCIFHLDILGMIL